MIHYEIEYLDDFYYIPTSIGEVVGNTRTTERGGESVVHKLKQFCAF